MSADLFGFCVECNAPRELVESEGMHPNIPHFDMLCSSDPNHEENL
jgi:hypothetical protein